MRSVFIYGLVCPIENRVRYVGQSLDPIARLRAHVLNSGNRHMRNWLALLGEKVPELITLEVTTEENANDRELAWIHHYRDRVGRSLINVCGVITGNVTGRPRKPQASSLSSRHNKPFGVRFTADELEEIDRAAASSGRSRSDLIRAGGLAYAEALINAGNSP